MVPAEMQLNECSGSSVNVTDDREAHPTSMKTILVTGAAGFIGSNLVKKLCTTSAEYTVIGIDNMNGYYDVRLKEQRLQELMQFPSFKFIKGSIADKQLIKDIFAEYNFESHKELVPMQPGDVPIIYADISALEADFGFKPSTTLREGLRKFAEWYVSDNNPINCKNV